MSTRIFDFHVRLAPRPDAVDRLLTSMDEHEVERAGVSAGGVIELDRLAYQLHHGGHVENDADNDAVLDAAERTGGRLVPFYFGNPHTGPADYRERAADFDGLEISPAVHGGRLDDERVTPFIEVAAEYRHPVYIVCLGRPGARADDLVALAQRFPSVSFVLGHCGFVVVDFYSVNRVAATPNILAETSASYTALAKTAVERLGPDRLLFGTEYPLQHPTVELAKVRALGLDDDAERRVMWENASRLVGAPDALRA